MKKSPTVEACVDELEKAGVRYTVTWASKHVHIHFGPDLQHLHVCAATPSDWRAPINERAQIRRELRAYGYVGVEAAEKRDLVPVNLVDGAPSCTSQDIAATFAKAHKDVLRAVDRVREECGPDFDQRNFAPIEYLDARGRSQRAFRMTRDGFVLVAMGFTGGEATAWKVKYIDAFNALESEVQRLVIAPPDLTSIREEFDALVTLVGDIESQTRRALPAPIPVAPQPVYALTRMERRKIARLERRRIAA